jgi:hypothetical protein
MKMKGKVVGPNGFELEALRGEAQSVGITWSRVSGAAPGDDMEPRAWLYVRRAKQRQDALLLYACTAQSLYR